MSTRDVYDTIYDPNGAPWPGLKITFDLIPSSYVLNGAYPSKRVSAVTDAEGAFTLTLWCSDEGLAQTSYQVTYPNDRFTVRVPTGADPITLSELRAMTAPESQPDPAAIAAHEAAADPHPGYLTPAEGDAAYAPLGHVADHANPHQVTAAQTGAYTTAQADGRYPLRSNNLSDLSDAAASRLHIAAASEAEIRAASAAVNQGNGYTVDDLAGVIGIVAHDTFNPVAYGADITGASDDTTAFQAAANDAMTYGGVVTVPAGTFNVGGIVMLAPGNNKRVAFKGAGYQTLIRPAVNGLTLFQIDQGSSNYQDMEFSDLRIEMGAYGGTPINVARGGQTGRISRLWLRGGAAVTGGLLELGTNGLGAAGTAVMSGTGVASVTMTAGGRGYVNGTTTVIFTGSGTGAAGTAVITRGQVTSVTMTAAGTGYSTPPTVAFASINNEATDFSVEDVYCYANAYVTDRPKYALVIGATNTTRINRFSSVGPETGIGNFPPAIQPAQTRSDLRIINSRLEKGKYGVKFEQIGVQGYSIVGSRFEDLSACGIYVWGYDASNPAVGGLIQGNYFTTLSDTGEVGVFDGKRSGIVIALIDGLSIIGNYFRGNTNGVASGNIFRIESATSIKRLLLAANSMNPAYLVATTIANYSTVLNINDATAMQVSRDQALSAGSGFPQTLEGWNKPTVAASLTAAPMLRGIPPSAAFICPRSGSIRGVTIRSDAVRTAGTCTATVYRSGVATTITAVLNGTNNTIASTNPLKGVDTTVFIAGNTLDVRLTTDAAWAAGTANIECSIDVWM